MKQYIKLNEVDISKWIARNGIRFSNVERRASSYTTLDGTDRSAAIILRGMTVSCVTMSEATAKTIFSLLQSRYVQVSYVDPAKGERTGVWFKASNASIAAKVVEGGRTFYSGLTFTLEERGPATT